MKYEVIMEKEQYSLISRGQKMKEYAVVNGLNKERGDWAWTCAYWCYECDGQPQKNQAEALANAVDYFRMRTEYNYISRARLEELATKFKDGLIEDDKESAIEYFENECELTEDEMEWLLGKPEEDNDEYIPCAENRDYSPSCPWNAPGMSIKDFI